MDDDGPNATWGCNDSFSTGNSVTGSFNVSDGTISASVGFSVTRTFTRGQSYSLAPGRGGRWRSRVGGAAARPWGCCQGCLDGAAVSVEIASALVLGVAAVEALRRRR